MYGRFSLRFRSSLRLFKKWLPCHFPVMVIRFVMLNLPTVLLMFFNKLASCPVPNINLHLKTAISCNVIIACSRRTDQKDQTKTVKDNLLNV